MKTSHIFFSSVAALALTACSQTDNVTETVAGAQEDVAETVTETVQGVQAQLEPASDKPDPAEAPTGTYTLDKGHAYITFFYDHQGYSRPYLRWENWDSTLNWSAENFEDSTVSVTIPVNGIDSGVDVFDDHLRSSDWFDVETYPKITFASTQVSQINGDTGTIEGDLTIKGITKPVTLDVAYNKAGFNQRGNVHKLGFSAKTSVLRSDFDLGAYVPFVGDNIDIIIEVEYDMPGEAESE